ncbi:MAG: DUF4834 domain-containing protein [Cyclobacteriaceae bacterium]
MIQLLSILLVSYLIYKIGGFFLRTFFLNAVQQQYQKNTNASRPKKPADGNVSVDYVPKEEKRKGSDFQGGDYVDYEIVKD